MNAIVTGSASGIGLALTDELSKRGHRVIATDVDFETLTAVAHKHGWSEPSVLCLSHDVRDVESWNRVIQRACENQSPLDLLCNVAGVIRPQWVHELTPEAVALQIDVNTKGVILGTSAAARVMVAQQKGHIVNIASMAAIAPIPGISVYSASKFAVRGFSLAVAQELEASGVAVTVLCPDAVITPMVDYQVDFPQAAMTFSGARMLSPEEVVRAIVDRILPRKPRDLVIPWNRGFVARLATLLPPRVVDSLSRTLTKKGRARQQNYRE